jgi:hypothetical protein
MILIAVRLLMPPGICACKWSVPAARFLVALTPIDREIPCAPEPDDDDHAPGCPASPLAVGMGVVPASQPLLPPGLTLDALPPLQLLPSLPSLCTDEPAPSPFHSPPTPLYLTVRALLL